MTKIRDAAGKNHEVEIQTERKFWNEDFGIVDVTVSYVDGERLFCDLGKDRFHSMMRAVENFLSANHHPSHYYGRFAHLAEVSSQMKNWN